MPPRTALLDFAARDFVCRSCRLSLRKQRPLPSWISSQAQLSRYSSGSAPHPSKPTQTAAPSDDPSTDNGERRRVLAQLGLLKDEKKVSVNYYEQEKDGDLRKLSTTDDFGRSLQNGLSDDLNKTQIEEMMKQLEETTRLLKSLGQAGGKDQITKLKKRLAEDLVLPTDEEEDFHLDANATEPILITETGWDGEENRRIQRLNRKLKRMAYLFSHRESSEITEHQRSALWKSYMLVHKSLIARRNVVPPAAWDLLWRSLASEGEDNQNRMAHIAVLARDMQQAGATLSDEQQLLAIEAMFIDGHEREAIENHRRLVTTLGTRLETAFDFWQLGLRMHCLLGDLGRAGKVVETITELVGEKDPRFLLPYIRACAAQSSSIERSYDAYRHLRDMLGDAMTIEDYDQIASYYLAVDRTDYALYVFVDMMSSGTVNIKGAERLPNTVANPFFFGKWVKRLIGFGELDSAHKVFLFMKDRGVVPRAIQVNGLLGAWLRSTSGDEMARADSVAWQMINARIQFVQIRKKTKELDTNIRLTRSGAAWPNATLETFKLLAESYNQRGIHPKMEDLWKAFRQAEIAPDAFMLNQLLFSYLKSGQGEYVTEVCQALADEHDIKPDQVTFRALWMAIPVNRLYTIRKSEYHQQIPEGRALFAEMVRAAAVFKGEEFDYQLARKVVHSFRKLDDKVGLLQAVRALRHVFNFFPPESLVLELLADTVDLEKMNKSPRARHGLVLHTQRMSRHLEQRRLELVKDGKLEDNTKLPDFTRQDELYNFLEGKLQESCIKSTLYPNGVEFALKAAAEEMGLH